MSIVNFTPLPALIGGALIGLAAALLWWMLGRIAGVSSILGNVVTEPGADSAWRVASVRPHGGNERTLCGAGRNDNLDESGFCVVDQARYDAAAGQGSPGDLDVDAYGGPRVVDLLDVEVCDWYLEELGELLREGGELLYAAVGVVQNRQVRGAGLWRVVGVALAELREQAPGAQDSRRDAAADVAHDNRFTKVETEHVGWIDTRVDAAEDLESMWRGKGEASERAACGERGVAADQLVGSDRHRASVSARNRLSELCRRTCHG